MGNCQCVKAKEEEYRTSSVDESYKEYMKSKGVDTPNIEAVTSIDTSKTGKDSKRFSSLSEPAKNKPRNKSALVPNNTEGIPLTEFLKQKDNFDYKR